MQILIHFRSGDQTEECPWSPEESMFSILGASPSPQQHLTTGFARDPRANIPRRLLYREYWRKEEFIAPSVVVQFGKRHTEFTLVHGVHLLSGIFSRQSAIARKRPQRVTVAMPIYICLQCFFRPVRSMCVNIIIVAGPPLQMGGLHTQLVVWASLVAATV